MTKIKLELELECEINEISLCAPMSICSCVSVGSIAQGVSIAHAHLSDRSYRVLKEISNLRASTIIEDNSN